MNLKEREKKIVDLYIGGTSCTNIATSIKIEKEAVVYIFRKDDSCNKVNM